MKSLALSLLLLGSATAQQAEPEPYAHITPLQEALERLLSERESPQALDAAIVAAGKLGATNQAILEARFIFHVDRREDAELAAMLPDFLKQKEKFRLSESQIFALEDDWLAVIEYVKAIAALQKDDRAGFKKHITEAFWLSPKQGAAFAPHIDRLRLEEAMRKIKIDFSLPLLDLAGNKTSLGTFAKDKKAVLLHFFSPWSRECETSIPDFAAVASELAAHDIAVITILGEDGPEVIADTHELLKALPKPAPGAWLSDHPDTPLNKLLRIQSVPAMVLLAPDGKVLFNGHPTNQTLWEKLVIVAPGISRPALSEDAEDDHH